MVDDKTLLQLAAKAAGYKITKVAMLGEGFWHALIDEQIEVWSPLHNDGDAFRLAVKLGIGVWQYMTNKEVGAEPYDTGAELCEWYGNDPYAATRRAIVRSAAAIGESM